MKEENELTLWRPEIRTIRWMCGIRVTGKFTCSELRERLGTDDIITVVQRHRLRWLWVYFKKGREMTSSSIQPSGYNRHEPKTEEWGCAPFRGELGPHLTQRRLGQGLPPYQVAS